MNGRLASRTLRAEIDRVVRAGNCSGCGGCATLSGSIDMGLSEDGYARPAWNGPDVVDKALSRRFRRICPGVAVLAEPRAGRRSHPTMGEYVSVWRSWATDPEIREAGSSGGVITALSSWILEQGVVSEVVGAGAGVTRPERTVTVQIRSRSDALAAAGSRYAPVSNAAEITTGESAAFVGKPCEVYAARRLAPPGDGPLLFSFFCAGVPAQGATDELIALLGVRRDAVTSLRYRGNGWPGRFRVEDSDGNSGELSYDESWGEHLGKRLQDRCKICPDGTGGHADVAVGDLWTSDDKGYPVFTDGAGVSVAVARTQRGHELLTAARRAGILVLEPIEMAQVAGVQPFQVMRRRTLLGRLVGRRIAGLPIPRYRGYHLLRSGAAQPRQTLSFARGSLRRARR
jgi:coenzyme F420 hydrogenase subunit beta